MELRTYTSLWQIERRLYRIDDVALPGAPTYKQIGIFFAVTVPWISAMVLLGIPFTNLTAPLWIMPPIAFTYFANKPLVESKTGLQLASSNLKFLAQSRVYTGLRGFSQAGIVYLTGRIWHRS